MVLTMLFFNGWRGKFGINIIIFLEEKKKFENISFLSKEYHYDYNGTIMEDRKLQTHLNSKFDPLPQ